VQYEAGLMEKETQEEMEYYIAEYEDWELQQQNHNTEEAVVNMDMT